MFWLLAAAAVSAVYLLRNDKPSVGAGWARQTSVTPSAKFSSRKGIRKKRHRVSTRRLVPTSSASPGGVAPSGRGFDEGGGDPEEDVSFDDAEPDNVDTDTDIDTDDTEEEE